MDTTSPILCSQCSSPLILVSEKTEVIEGSRFPQTTKEYRCSNEACQEEIDKQTAKRKQQKQERQTAELKRSEEKQRMHSQRKELLAVHN